MSSIFINFLGDCVARLAGVRTTRENLEREVSILEGKYIQLLKLHSARIDEHLKDLREYKAYVNSTKPSAGFTKEEINSLIRLCHPDKHDGKYVAVKLTQKLLKMR